MTAPTLHLRSAAYVNAHRADFPHAYSIQRAPRADFGHVFDGFVEVLRPTHDEWELGQVLVRARRDGAAMDPDMLAAYRGSMEHRWAAALRAGVLRPRGLMVGAAWTGDCRPAPVPDGAVLTCSCGPGKDCHRRWAAPILARAGWSVVLDGVPLG